MSVPFSGVPICQVPRKSSSLLCAWAPRTSKLEIARPQKSKVVDRKNRVYLCLENIVILTAYFSQSQQARINRGAFAFRPCGHFVYAAEPLILKQIKISRVFQYARNPVGCDWCVRFQALRGRYWDLNQWQNHPSNGRWTCPGWTRQISCQVVVWQGRYRW